MLFKWFPDTEVAWGDVFPGAAATAVLFNLGKFAIGWDIGTRPTARPPPSSSFLVWVSYAAQDVLCGSELTQAYAAERGSRRGETAEAGSPHKINS